MMLSSVRRYSPGEPFDVEGGHVDGGLGAQVQVADRLSHRGSLQEPVPGESGRVQEAEPAGIGFSDEGVAVRRHFVQPGPAGGELHAGQRRRELRQRGAELVMPVGGHGRVESNRLLLGGDPDQQARAVIVAVEVGGGAVVDGERYARWPRVKRCGEGDLATEGFDRQVHVDHRTDLLRPSAAACR